MTKFTRLSAVTDGTLNFYFGPSWPCRDVKPGDIVGVVSNLGAALAPAPLKFDLVLTLEHAKKSHTITMPAETFLSTEEYARSLREPFELFSCLSVLAGC